MVSHDRRTVLAAIAAGATGPTGGCLDRLGGLAGGDADRQVSLTVKAPAPDDDPFADGIAREVASWLRTAGMNVSVVSLAPSELRSQVLEDHAFDLFVSRVPGRFHDPDGLHALLHSRYAVAPGWNNPFGVSHGEIDDLLDAQRRRSGRAREAAVGDVATTVAEMEPFSVVCFPEEIRTARRDRFVGFSGASLDAPTGFLSLGRAESGTDEADAEGGPRAAALHLASTDELVTERMNPLSTVGGVPDAISRLLYDPLGRQLDDEIAPWLAEEWTFADDGRAPRATVRLRSDHTWHDGESVTADDVSFTYDFLADVRLADSEDPIAVPRFLGRTSLVEEVSAVDDRSVTIQFIDCDRGVATRALTVPILPEHVWEDRVAPTDGGGEQRSAAAPLQTNNVPPVGSGPLSFDGNVPGERLSLASNDDHFLVEDDLPARFARFDGPAAYDRLVLEVVGADTSAVERVASGQADATFTPLPPEVVPRVARAAELRLYTDDADSFYAVGYNARREHLSNHRFRAVLGGLLDQASLVRSVFQGYAAPAASPLAGTPWLPERLRFEGEDPVTPFLGSDGDLDAERARDAFREVGYRYDGDALVTE